MVQLLLSVFQNEFPTLKENTVWEFRKNNEKLLKENKAKSPKKVLELERRDRPLMIASVGEKMCHENTIRIIQFSNSDWTILESV